jgi:hydroxyethylthiazole kinase
VSGAIDFVTDGVSTLAVRTGHEIMTRVTGVGCSLGALVAACCAVETSPVVAASAATTILTVAAELAEKRSQGPGTFAMGLLDELYTLDADRIRSHVAATA